MYSISLQHAPGPVILKMEKVCSSKTSEHLTNVYGAKTEKKTIT
jgi:hypothetical protein